jgi:hypothetical protein
MEEEEEGKGSTEMKKFSVLILITGDSTDSSVRLIITLIFYMFKIYVQKK